jgi:hypothetical protein
VEWVTDSMPDLLLSRDKVGIGVLQIACIVLSMLTAAIATAAGPEPERQLEAAIHQEIVIGNLSGAINRYTKLIADPAASRSVAARALLRIGACQEKLGQRNEAYETYRRAAATYGDQTAVAAEVRTRLAAWSGPRNLKFDEGVPGKVPPGWFVPSLPKDADYLAELRHDGCRSHTGCAVVLVPVNVPRPVGNLMQSFSAAAYTGKTIRLRAWLKLERFYFANTIGVRFPALEDRAQMWLNVERPNRRHGFSDNMDDRPVLSSDWTRCEITGDIDDDARFINFGVMSIGGGRLWVDDVSFEVIPKR